MSYLSEVLADGPLAYYRLDETGGTAMIDSSGAGRHGVYGSPLLLGAPGLLNSDTNKAVYFNGTSNSRADVAYGSWMDVNSITLEAWASTRATGIVSLIDRDTTTTNPNARSWQFRLNAGKFEFVAIAGTGGVVTASSPLAYNDGAPHHFAVTYDTANIRLYVDGALVITTPRAGTLANGVGISLAVNNSVPQGAAWFPGTLDEAVIYGTALSSSRIAAHHAAGIASPPWDGSGTWGLVA